MDVKPVIVVKHAEEAKVNEPVIVNAMEAMIAVAEAAKPEPDATNHSPAKAEESKLIAEDKPMEEKVTAAPVNEAEDSSSGMSSSSSGEANDDEKKKPKVAAASEPKDAASK